MNKREPGRLRTALSKISKPLRVVLGIFLVFSAIWKIEKPYEFLNTVYRYEILGANLAFCVAYFLPWVESVVGLTLVLGVFTKGALILCFSLFCGFLVAQGTALARGQALPCGCAGPETDPIDWLTFFRTLFFLMTTVFVSWFVFFPPGRDGKSASTSLSV
ncbi:MAG: hypothetical protein HY040_16755 [Planctomycetes bacterium]|nr:hypothetical protein [Planctomycetota bacterium]